MTRQNTIADGMCAIKNAGDTGKSVCIIEPASKLLGAMLRIMQDAGYIGSFEFIDDGRGGQLKVNLTGRSTAVVQSARGFRYSWMRWNIGR